MSEKVNNVYEDDRSPLLVEIVNWMISNDMILLAMRTELDLMAKQFESDIVAN